ncbi:hypothetical protein [Herpetosiphon gulosus]|uniref:Uncharacterized protein n=1 Tax=Herpetosiphon gulosus TaxID=1973496 RepID=A0ABP9X6F9_9CHLR
MTAHMLSPRRRRSPFARIGGRMVENESGFVENAAPEEEITLAEATPDVASMPVAAAPMAELPPITAVIPRAVTAIVEPVAQPMVDHPVPPVQPVVVNPAAPVQPDRHRVESITMRPTEPSTPPATGLAAPIAQPERPRYAGPRVPRARSTTQAFAPHADRWGTNHITVVGRATNDPVTVVRPTAGGAFNRYTVAIYDQVHGHDDVLPQISTVVMLVPRDAASLNLAFQPGRMLTVSGRLVVRTHFDGRYARTSEFGGLFQTQPYVLVGSAALTRGDASRQQYLIGQLSGTVTGVLKEPTSRFRFDRQHEQVVLMRVTEAFDRPPPARGQRIEHQIVPLLVPLAVAETLPRLEPGMRIQTEVELHVRHRILGNHHFALSGVPDEAKSQLRHRERWTLVATWMEEQIACNPASDASDLS